MDFDDDDDVTCWKVMADVVEECRYANSRSMSTFSEETWVWYKDSESLLVMVVIMIIMNIYEYLWISMNIDDGNDGDEKSEGTHGQCS